MKLFPLLFLLLQAVPFILSSEKPRIKFIFFRTTTNLQLYLGVREPRLYASRKCKAHLSILHVWETEL